VPSARPCSTKAWWVNARKALGKERTHCRQQKGSFFHIAPEAAAHEAGILWNAEQAIFVSAVPVDKGVSGKLLRLVLDSGGSVAIISWKRKYRELVDKDGAKLRFGPKLAAEHAGIDYLEKGN